MASSANDFAAVRFSTDDLPERARLDFIREVIGRTVTRLDMAPLPDVPFRSELAIQAVPGLAMISGVNAGLRAGRTGRHLADGSDDFVLSIQIAGVTIASQRGHEATIGPGGAVLLSLAQTGSATFPTASRMTSLTLPRASLAPFVANVDDAVMRPVPKGGEALRLLASYLRELENGYALKAPELRRLAVGHIHDLVALVIGAGRDATETARAGGLRAARLHAILEAIRAGFADPAFSAQRVARKLGISPRYIQDLLHETGASFTERVLELRLEQARKMLTDLPSPPEDHRCRL